jgi:hypothetical protein
MSGYSVAASTFSCPRKLYTRSLIICNLFISLNNKFTNRNSGLIVLETLGY